MTDNVYKSSSILQIKAFFNVRNFHWSVIASHRATCINDPFYDDNGLIQSNRNGGGHRRFERAQIRRVSFVIAAQKFGYTLPQIKELLDSLPNERTPTAEEWEQLSEKFRESLHAKSHIDVCREFAYFLNRIFQFQL